MPGDASTGLSVESYRANAEGEVCDWVVAHDEYCRLGDSATARQATYRALFEAYIALALVTAIRAAPG